MRSVWALCILYIHWKCSRNWMSKITTNFGWNRVLLFLVVSSSGHKTIPTIIISMQFAIRLDNKFLLWTSDCDWLKPHDRLIFVERSGEIRTIYHNRLFFAIASNIEYMRLSLIDLFPPIDDKRLINQTLSPFSYNVTLKIRMRDTYTHKSFLGVFGYIRWTVVHQTMF